MSKGRLYVDLNELIEAGLVLLSQHDFKRDSEGNEIFLFEGRSVDIYMDDVDENGCIDNLIASGVVERNNTGLFPVCKWNCRIDQRGIRHQSEA